MPCLNHPAVEAGLENCSRCAKTFCIDCLVGRKGGWFCAKCDQELGGPATAAPRGKACKNHAEIVANINPCAACGSLFCADCLVELQGRRFCAACKVNAVKDIQSGVDGTGLQLATLGARFCAVLIDNFVTGAAMMVLFGIMVVIGLLLQPEKDSMVIPLLIFAAYGLIFVAMFCYHGFMLQWKGQTLGKMAMRIKVVTPEGGPITPGQAWIRVLVWFLLHGCAVTYLTAFFNNEKLAIHDMAARTRVVKID